MGSSFPQFRPIEHEYLKRKPRNWYQLFGGPNNLRELACHLGRGGEYEVLYRRWSSVVHAMEPARNPFYISHVRWADAHNENGTHPHAIDTELWEAAQRVTRQHTIHSQRGASRPGHPLTGLARCAFCEHAMAYVPKEETCGIRCSFLLDEMTNRELNQVYLQLIDHVLLARKQDPVIVWL